MWCEDMCDKPWHPRDIALFQSIATSFFSGRLEFNYADKPLKHLVQKYTN